MKRHLEYVLEEQIPQQHWHSFWITGSGMRPEMGILISGPGNFGVDSSSTLFWRKLGDGSLIFQRQSVVCGPRQPKGHHPCPGGPWLRIISSASSLVPVQLWLPNLWGLQPNDHLALKDHFLSAVISLPKASIWPACIGGSKSTHEGSHFTSCSLGLSGCFNSCYESERNYE